MNEKNNYVSRAGYKLAEAAKAFRVTFKDKTVLDIGSSTGGFTDYALQNGAKRVIAVELGTKQMHPKLAIDERVELYEKTDILKFQHKDLDAIDIVTIDVSFISLKKVLSYISFNLTSNKHLLILAMLKPQFEADSQDLVEGVVKNKTIRRRIIKEFEQKISQNFIIISKKDNSFTGAHGNLERFYLLELIKH